MISHGGEHTYLRPTNSECKQRKMIILITLTLQLKSIHLKYP